MKKLSYTTEELFLIKKNIKNVIYELKILKTKIYKTFNVNNLIKVNLIISLIKELKVKNKEKKYEVNKTLKKRKNRKQTEFFIN